MSDSDYRRDESRERNNKRIEQERLALLDEQRQQPEIDRVLIEALKLFSGLSQSQRTRVMKAVSAYYDGT